MYVPIKSVPDVGVDLKTGVMLALSEHRLHGVPISLMLQIIFDRHRRSGRLRSQLVVHADGNIVFSHYVTSNVVQELVYIKLSREVVRVFIFPYDFAFQPENPPEKRKLKFSIGQ